MRALRSRLLEHGSGVAVGFEIVSMEGPPSCVATACPTLSDDGQF